jgi:transcriptional regulator with XRE-family HTH domain
MKIKEDGTMETPISVVLNEWFRKQKKWKSRADFARAIEIKESTLSSYFNGRNSPNPENRQKLFRATGLKCFKPVETRVAPQLELPVKKSELMRQLADQLTAVFIVALLCLWLAVTRPGKSAAIKTTSWPWWCFAILSVITLFIWLIMGRKRNVRPKLWWTAFGVALAIIWFQYLIKKVYIGSGFFFGLADFLLIWAALLLLAIGLITTKWGTKGKLGQAITWVIKQRYIYDPLSILVAFSGIFLGWTMLVNAGVKDWWLIPLLFGGLLVFFIVGLVYACTSHSGSNRN